MNVELTCYVSPARVFARTMKVLTRNVSRTGMLMHWAGADPLPRVGKKLTVEIELPESTAFGSRVMQCSATVIRVDTAGNAESSVALKIHTMKFVEIAPPKAGLDYVVDLAAMPLQTTRAM